jgi:hypothetical protein
MSAILLTSGTDGQAGASGLAARRMLSLRGAAGTRVRCTRGRGWITVEGDPADYWLGAGEEFQIRAATRVVIEAEPCSELVVTPPRAESTPYASPRQGALASEHGALQEAIVNTLLQQHPARSYRKWNTAGTGVETVLFVSVQALMFVCIALVVAQLFATA